MSQALPADEADTPPSPPDRGLAAVQLRKLAQVSAAAVELAQGINRRATEADSIGGGEAMTFVRVARAVRLTIAMEIRIGGYQHARTDRLLQKLGKVSGAGLDLTRLAARLMEDGRCGLAEGVTMFARLATATRQTIALEMRLDEEDCMTPERRAALQARRDAAAARAEGRDVGAVGGGAPVRACQNEWLEDADIDAELGDRSVDEVLADVCLAIGVAPEAFGEVVAAESSLTPALSLDEGEGALDEAAVLHSPSQRLPPSQSLPLGRVAGEGGARRVGDGRVGLLVHDPP
jgi:hypothetical protein